MSSALSAFNWRNKPSIFACDAKFVHRHQGGAGMPAKDHPLRNTTASIASPEPVKQKPGVGWSATV